jgi:acyl carrier protein
MMELSREEIQARLTGFLEELFEIPREKVTLDTSLYEDLDLDSIDAVDLVVQLQGLIGRRIKPEEFKTVRTIRDAVDCVERLLAADAPVES